MATGLEYNASTRNMHRVMTAFSEYGNNRFPDGVNDTGTPIDYLVSWLGPIPEQYDSLDNFAKIDDLIFLNESIHIQDVMLIRGYNYGLTRDEIKMILMQYGAIATAYSWDTRAPDYNISSFAAYSTKIGNGNHAMTLIGWDDNYSKNNFYTLRLVTVHGFIKTATALTTVLTIKDMFIFPIMIKRYSGLTIPM